MSNIQYDPNSQLAEIEAREARNPVCSQCGEYIYDGVGYRITDKLICFKCADQNLQDELKTAREAIDELWHNKKLTDLGYDIANDILSDVDSAEALDFYREEIDQ